MNGHGGARPGAGRKAKADKYEPQISLAETRIADRLPLLLENLEELADGGYQRVKEKWERRGAITVKSYAYDDNGVPHAVEKAAYPDLDPDELVLTERVTETADRDRAANIYLVDRILGRPTQMTELTGKDGGPVQVRGGQFAGLSDAEIDALETLLEKIDTENTDAPQTHGGPG